jgi:predicted TIM-barrel enzyme
VSATERPRHVLVLANETVAGKTLIDALKSRGSAGQVRVTVLSPQNESRAGFVVYESSRRSAAERRLRRTLDLLHEAGIAARGAVVDPDPLQALRDGIDQYEPDEIIISTHPELRSGWLRGNLIDRVRKAAGSIPVEHVVVDLEAPRELTHVLVVANQTMVGAPLLEAIQERAEQGPAEFTLVAPADQPGVERRLELALRRLEAARVKATGHIGDGDPYTAVMNAVHDEQIDEVVISTFPTSTSGWMRRDLVERVQDATSLPVTHVVVEPGEARAAAQTG